jgi:hypothetical protein
LPPVTTRRRFVLPVCWAFDPAASSRAFNTACRSGSGNLTRPSCAIQSAPALYPATHRILPLGGNAYAGKPSWRHIIVPSIAATSSATDSPAAAPGTGW